MVPGGGTAGRRLTSAVWKDFDYNIDGAGIGKATCRRCGLTLCAGGAKGTSHLHRHLLTKGCGVKWRQRQHQHLPAASTTVDDNRGYSAPPGTAADFSAPAGTAADDGEDSFARGIAVLMEQLERDKLTDIDQGSAANYVPMPQAASSSSRRFFQRAKERISAAISPPFQADGPCFRANSK
ncbi:unnamed protein product [Urochloa humidicola]